VDRARRLPVISAWRELPDAGRLMSNGTSVPSMGRRAATHVDRILKTAKALGFTIPPSVLLRPDRVTE
jgi:hypothetical protein